MKIKVYTAHYCSYCRAAKDLLTSKKLPFEEIDVSADEEFDALVEKTGWKTVPQIFIDGKLIGGFEELKKLDQQGKL
ncbi:MAG: glutaredoxin [Deltaproteobacteria bacterium]|nr:glutaredoxin [Deltaproteobacteria bacterium]